MKHAGHGTSLAARPGMLHSPEGSLGRPSIVIVSRGEHSSDGALDHLRNLGATVTRTARLDGRYGDPLPDTVVFFSDDFPMIEIFGAIQRELLKGRATCVAVVSRYPREHESLFGIPGADGRLVLLARPIWGWCVLDSILSRSE
jgi:hypothetical protein